MTKMIHTKTSDEVKRLQEPLDERKASEDGVSNACTKRTAAETFIKAIKREELTMKVWLDYRDSLTR